MPSPTLWGRAYFPGVQAVVSAEYTNSHGTDPGVALLTIQPQPGYPANGGTLTFFDGRRRVVLPNCKVAKVTAQRAGLLTWTLAILDRRWRWRGGAISGHYNTRGKSGLIKVGTERTPQALASLLFLAMGETRFNVAALPNDARPQVDWELVEPARALTELCERLGCRVVYRVSADMGSIVRLGVGAKLPVGDVLQAHQTVEGPQRPDELWYAGGQSLFQAEFYAEPVGLDVDGSIRPLRQLSYAPKIDANNAKIADYTGWENCAPPHFAKIKNATANACARLSVYRWHRLKLVDPGTINCERIANRDDTVRIIDRVGKGLPSVPGDKFSQNYKGSVKVNSFATILPCEDFRLTPADPKFPEDYGASVRGWFLIPGLDGRMTRGELPTRYEGAFSIDKERGLVCFKDYVTMRGRIRNGDTDNLMPAMLFVTLAVNLRDTEGEPTRYIYRQRMNGPRYGTLPEVVRREESVLQVAVAPLARKLVSNQALLDAEARYYLQAVASKYSPKEPEDITYAGLQAIDCDGAIEQVTYSIPPCTTRASRHCEHSLYLDAFKDRLTLMQGREILDPQWLSNTQKAVRELKEQQANKPLDPRK